VGQAVYWEVGKNRRARLSSTPVEWHDIGVESGTEESMGVESVCFE